MKYKNRISYLNVLLNIVLVVFVVLIFTSMFYILFREKMNINMEDMNLNVYLQIFIGVVFAVGYIMIILTLKKILKSIQNKDPFNFNNIVYFKRIGYYILAVGIIYGVMSYPMVNNSYFHIMATSYGSLKPTFFLHIILSLLSFIISDVFKMSMEIKDENDLTV